ncbi:DUF3450 domain-containing protein [Corallincola holothuriorum]|uniref:DUF3450 domain-containing protein n=1 Tax=Corallincola holothuriorum TaxID=2282215 RepID=A0A368NGU5_9GAMM|nr:DUF3450 domain-containing protein [Corallincola holothuriorum]RCU49406.1 DUF3450 domain-containing protein [Corallincola holothuriorum]
MSRVLKKSLIASALAGAFAFATVSATAEPLSDVQAESVRIHKEAAKSQDKIDSLYEQSQDLLVEYREVVDQTENLKVYNDHLQRLVNDQNAVLSSLQTQIDGIEETRQGVVPLMYRMIDTLEQFIALDVPILLKDRTERVERLRELMGRSDVTTSEKYRQVLEAYQIENDYGNKIASYQGELELDGSVVTVDLFHLGRVVFVAQSLDQKNAWVWDNDARAWQVLGDEYLNPITQAIRMARKQAAVDLIKLPVKAAESGK